MKLTVNLCLYMASAILACLPVLYLSQHVPSLGKTDFEPTIIAAKLVNQGHRDAVYANAPYSDNRNPDWIREETMLTAGTYNTVYAYSPLYLRFFSPLVRTFSYDNLVYALLVINLLALGLFAALLALLLPDDSRFRAAGIVLVVSANSAMAALLLGQNTLPFVLSCFAFYYAINGQRTILACLAFGAAILMKPWAPVLLAFPFFKRDYFHAGLLAILFISVTAVTWFLEPDLLQGFLKISHQHSDIRILAYNNYSLAAALQRLALHNWSIYQNWKIAPVEPVVGFGLRLLIAAGAVFAGWLVRRDYVRLLAACVLFFALSRVFWDHYSLLFLPLIVYELKQLWQDRQRAIFWIGLAFSLLVYYPGHMTIYVRIFTTLYPLTSQFTAQKMVALFSIVPSALFIGALLVGCWRDGVFREWRTRVFDFQFEMAQLRRAHQRLLNRS
ncbi:MAG: DUF2029 domain-containing protein [Leptospiraceae bacterium]|nr:DUF2029 domain-containing protein [Leptospiraceae bacterium]